MLSGVMSSPRRASPLPPAERRAALIAATLPLLREHGITVSTRQIAEAAGVAEGTIFRVFPDKESLIRAAVESAFDVNDLLADLASVDRDLPFVDRLVSAVDAMQERLRTAFSLLDVLRLTVPPHGHPNGRPDRSEQNALIVEAIADLIGQDRSQLACSAFETARILRLMMFAGTHPLITEGQPLTANQIVSLLLDGVRDRCPQQRPHGSAVRSTLTEVKEF